MRRTCLLAVGAILWLLAAATPVLADGGPHTMTANAGTGSMAGDCAACHRAHTAQAGSMLREAVPALCLSCHDGTGATTDVVDGVQFAPASWTGTPGTDAVLGALRGGGFSYALINSSNAARLYKSNTFLGKVGVLSVASKEPTTSRHGGTGTVWGNGLDGTPTVGAGPVSLTCTDCHNPHGNGQYRILRSSPGETWSSVAGWSAPSQAVEVKDVSNPTNATLNYTILPGTFATDVIATAAQGDYWRRNIPWNTNAGVHDPMQVGWNGTSPTNAAANGGVAPDNGTGLMTAWCVQCHTRYSGLVNGDGISSSMAAQPDDTFTYRHLTMNYGCEQCHVSHGSNALMYGSQLNLTDPAGVIPSPIPSAGPTASQITSGDSRLLKVDNRGTCQLCHDPTNTIKYPGAPISYSGPLPTPGIP